MTHVRAFSESACLSAIAQGDEGAFDDFYARMERPVMTLCAAILDRRDLAQEALQEAFLEWVRSRHRWAEIRNPRAYLFQVARRVSIELRQKEARRPASVSENLPLVEIRAPGAPDAMVRRETVDRALRKLPHIQREIVVMKHLSGLTLAEAAEAVGENPKTVESRYAAGMARLREILAQEEIG